MQTTKENSLQIYEDKIVNEIRNYKKDKKDIIEFLNFMNKFYKYSVKNTLLIRAQWKGAIAVESFQGWKKLGANVKKGEKSHIKIFVPIQVQIFKGINGKYKGLKYANKKEKLLIKQGKIKVTKKLKFRLGNVFDITQTDIPNKDYPKYFPNKRIEIKIDEDKYLYLTDKLYNFAAQLNIPVQYDNEHLIGNAKGAYIPTMNSILLNKLNTKIEKVTVMIHELAHAILHKNSKLKVNLKELQAEMTCYLVSSYFNIEITKNSVDYIYSWNKNLEEIKEEELEKLLKEVKESAKKIINFIEK